MTASYVLDFVDVILDFAVVCVICLTVLCCFNSFVKHFFYYRVNRDADTKTGKE